MILLVEDNAGDEELTLRALRRGRVLDEVVVARDGAEALEFLRTAGDLPRFVLLDLNLPKIGGLDVLRRLRGDPRTKGLPVVVLTSSKQERDVLTAYELGANSYVVKPVDYARYAEAVQEISAYWLVRNQVPLDIGGLG